MPGPRTRDLTPIVGRDAELARLSGLLETAVANDGMGRAVLITGPSGVGKSRLVHAFKQRLRTHGRQIFEGWCRRTDHRPHGPILDLLASSASLLSDLGRQTTATEHALGLIGGFGRGEARRAEEPQLAFYEAVRHALIEAAAVLPPVILLHDLDRADTTTLRLIRYLLDNLLADPAFEWAPPEGVYALPDGAIPMGRAFRGLLVLSLHLDEATQPLLDVANSSAAVEHLPLAPLGADGVRAYLQSPAIIDRLLKASGGLPAALEHLLAAVPDDPATAWAQRFSGLSQADRRVLDALAVFERPATVDQVRTMAELTTDPLPLLSALLGRNLVERTLDRGRLAFRMPGTSAREAWLDALAPAARQALHRRIAEQLALAGDMGADPAEIARHLLEGGAAAEAVPFALAAADRLERAFAFVRAAELLEEVIPAVEGALRPELLNRLARLYCEAGDLHCARQTLEALLALSPSPDPGRVARLAALHLRARNPQQAAELAAEALETCPDGPVAWSLKATLAESAYATGDLALAETYAQPFADATEAGPVLSLRNTLGKVFVVREAFDEARQIFASNLQAAAAADDASHQARASINLGIVHLQRGETDEALDRFEVARDLCLSSGDLRNLTIAVENMAVLYHRRQDFARALVHYHQSSAAARQLGQQPQLATTALNLAELYLTVGDLTRAQRLADIAGALIQSGHHRMREAQRLEVEAGLAQAAGDLDRAAIQHEAALELIVRGEASHQRQEPLLCGLAEVRIKQGRLADAERLLERSSTLSVAHSDAFAARLRTAQARLAVAQGRADDAHTLLSSALELAEQAGDREVRWQALTCQADAYWVAGQRAETLQSLAAAVELIERIASDLPKSMQADYVEAPRRQPVRDALRRVRAGLPPRGEVVADDARARRRTEGGYQARWQKRYPRIIGKAPSLCPVFNAMDRVAGSDSMVLIRGESGTGKELVASALHDHSSRASHAFIKVNCAAFVETLLLSELFGHEKGAFTGAVSSKKGRFELAHGGTLFLDEIGDVSPNTQVALLRVLQEGTFERVGGGQTLNVDVRVICATHRNLEEMVQAGTFRADLYYRLRGVIIELPALRKRREDIPLLVQHFLLKRVRGDRRLHFSRPALASLLQHEWPGNIRELENVVRSVALFADGDVIGLSELAELGDLFSPPDEQALLDLSAFHAAGFVPEDGAPARANRPPADEAQPEAPEPDGPPTEGTVGLNDAWLSGMLEQTGGLAALKKHIEFEAISRAIVACEGNITQAARQLGMKRPRLSQIIHGNEDLGALKRKVDGK
jgi:transcriptional regulator with GAF, ATPase, and Fis domain/Tfp pilus assembly protein PilF